MRRFPIYFNGGSDGLITVTTDDLGYKHVSISGNSGNRVGKYSEVEVPKGVGTLNVSTYESWAFEGEEKWVDKELTVYFCDRAYWLYGSQIISLDTDVDISRYAGAELMIFYDGHNVGLGQQLLIKGYGSFSYEEWTFDEDDEITFPTLPMVGERWQQPYPAWLWRFVRGELEHPLLPGYVDPQGAFKYASELTRVHIPDSVKQIGEEAFRYTALKRVSIADDCECSQTSFPENCVVSRRSTVPCGQLYDADGKAVIDRDAVRIYVKNTEEEL